MRRTPPAEGISGPRKIAAVALGAILLAAACGGSNGSDGASGTTGTSTAGSASVATSRPDDRGGLGSPGSSAAAPSEGDGGAVDLGAARSDAPGSPGPGDNAASGPRSAAAAPAPGPIEPLTGEPLEDPSILDRPALAVKIGTSSVGRPQTGINQADVLIEVRVETITRLMAVFHSQDAISLGPVRSARSSDPDILSNFGQPVFGHSGANPGVLREISQGQSSGKLHELRWDNLPTDYWRVGDRVAPFNLYTATSAIWENAPRALTAPEPLFDYRGDGEALPAGAEPVPGVEIRYLGGTVVHFAWDGEAGGWARWQDETPHVDMARRPDGAPDPDVAPVQVTPANVVVLQTRYTGSVACSYCPEAITVDPDGGVALVFTGGHMIRGRWSRPSADQPWQVTDNDGNPVRLAPGQTFVALPGGDVLVMVEDFAEHLLQNRSSS